MNFEDLEKIKNIQIFMLFKNLTKAKLAKSVGWSSQKVNQALTIGNGLSKLILAIDNHYPGENFYDSNYKPSSMKKNVGKDLFPKPIIRRNKDIVHDSEDSYASEEDLKNIIKISFNHVLADEFLKQAAALMKMAKKKRTLCADSMRAIVSIKGWADRNENKPTPMPLITMNSYDADSLHNDLSQYAHKIPRAYAWLSQVLTYIHKHNLSRAQGRRGRKQIRMPLKK